MSSTLTLPPSLRRRLGSAARRLRLLRAARGLGLLALLLGIAAAAALAADFRLDLPPATRQAIFSGWVGLGVVLFLVAVVVPFFRRPSATALAAAVEQVHPELGERLTSAVELAQGPVHGSPALAALVVEDAAARAEHLDFHPAVSGRRARLWLGAGVVVLLALLAPVALWPEQARARADRFLHPWQSPTVVTPFAIDVHPGDAYAARGRTFAVTALLRPRGGDVELPGAATLVVVEPDGKEGRAAMTPDGETAFKAEHHVGGDFRYRVEAGAVSSPEHSVTAVTPVELAADSPLVTVTPPAYARGSVETETVRGLVDLSALEHSAVRIEIGFTRPAVAARLEWLVGPAGDTGQQVRGTTRILHPLALAADGLSASLVLPAVAAGRYRLVFEAEHGITTEYEGGSLTVRPDLPPAVVGFSGREDAVSLLAHDRLSFELRLADDVGVAGAAMEYRVGNAPAEEAPLTLEGADTPRAVGRVVLPLSGKVKEGDEVAYRFRVRDNLPKEYHGPHTVYYPADRWLVARVVRRGASVGEQEVLAQREDVNRRLAAIREDLFEQQKDLARVRHELRGSADLDPESSERLAEIRRRNEDSRKALRELAGVAARAPGLESLGERVGAVDRKELPQVQEALRAAGKSGNSPTERDAQLGKADRALWQAMLRLGEMEHANERLAQQRQDLARLQRLADRQKALADRAADLAGKDPARDPLAAEASEQLRRDQAEVAADLEKLARESPLARRALDEASADHLRQAAEDAREMARAQRELAETSDRAEQARAAERLAKLAPRQKELAEQARRLAEKTRLPARAAMTPPLQPDAAHKAAEAMRRGDAREAMRMQEAAARDLDRMARALSEGAKVSEDPRQAARQLARLQEGLRNRVRDEVARAGDGRPPDERLRPLRQEQEAIRRAAERLSVPPTDKAEQGRREAAERAADAARALEQNPVAAAARMEEAQRALERLGDSLPSLAQRREEARGEAARLRKEQEAVARDAAAVKKDTPDAGEKLADAARRQEQIARALQKMDAPNEEGRRAQAHEAAEKARADLAEGRPEAAARSQQEARQQLARLEEALSDRKPAGEKSREPAGGDRQPGKESAAGSKPDGSAGRQQASRPEAAPALPDHGQADEARQLARTQQELQKAVQKAAGSPKGGKGGGGDHSARRQQELRDRAGQLAEDLGGVAQQLGRDRPAQAAAEQAGRSADAARKAMDGAAQQGSSGDGESPADARQRAAQSLDRAADQASHAASRLAQRGTSDRPGGSEPGEPSPGLSRAGQLLRQAHRQMGRAQERIARGQPGPARAAMEQASRGLGEASEAMARPSESGRAEASGRPGGSRGPGLEPGGMPDLTALGVPREQFAGKTWGELPGELRTRILQDVKARYGDDYARAIKLYFEQIAAPLPPRAPAPPAK
jgi:hypothetical protein